MSYVKAAQCWSGAHILSKTALHYCLPPVTPEAMLRPQELSLFIAANWMELPDAEEGEPYYHNTITGRSQWVEPQPPTKFLLDDEGTMLLAEDEQDRVMPSRKDVTLAGRYDLHHAIVYHGGYRVVSRCTALHHKHRPRT